MTRQSLGLILILIFYGIVGSLYIVFVPLFEASDEAEHFIHIHTILETDALPVIQSRDEMANQTDPILRWNNQSHHAPLYYVTSALLISWSDRADLADYLHPNELIFLRNTIENNPNKWLHRYSDPTSDTHLAIYQLRIMNLLIGASTLLMVYGATQQLTDRQSIPLLTMLFVASIPTFLVVNTSVTNDALVIFLYSAGLFWTLKAWRTETFSIVDIISISLILAGIALTKLTGVTLFGVVFLTLFYGAYRQKWSWQQVLQIIVITGITGAVLAGWWYLRNLTLYGDLLAVDATASIWGREEPLTLTIFIDNLRRIGKSFWMMIGYLHNPVFVADAFYIYATIATLTGFIGTYIWGIRQKQVDKLLILLLACFIVTAMLLYGTFSVDISYGRLLMPAISAFAPLIVIGWAFVFKRWAFIFVLPFAVTAIITPLLIVPDAYLTLQPVESIPDDAIRVYMPYLDTPEIVAIDVPNGVVSTGDILPIDIYFRGNHPTNPALTITAIDTIHVQRFDHIEVFPGMADMRELPEDQLYRASFQFEISQPVGIRAPRIIHIIPDWVDLDTNQSLLVDLSAIQITASTYVDEDYQVALSDDAETITFGDEILLLDVTVPETVNAGETLSATFIWNRTEQLSSEQEAILTLQLFDENGEVVAQNDGTLWWYPTTRWADAPFADTRTLDIPEDVLAGVYQLGIGWYRVVDDAYPRLSLADSENDLYMIPITITEAQ